MNMQLLEARLGRDAITLCDTLAKDFAPERDGDVITFHGISLMPAANNGGIEVWRGDKRHVVVRTATEAIAITFLLLAEPKRG